MKKKVVVRIADTDTLIPASILPGSIAETVYPPPERCEAEGKPLHDPEAVKRLLVETSHARRLRQTFPCLSADHEFSIGDVRRYLADNDLELEVRRPGERSITLAGSAELNLADWKELTGIRCGEHATYRITDQKISCKRWAEDDIAGRPADEQADMRRDNETAVLEFPCSPAALLAFVDTFKRIPGFSVPDAFRQAVAENAQRPGGQDLATLVSEDREDSPLPHATMEDPVLRAENQTEILRKRGALIQELEKIWPAIERDLRDASRNGLSAVAKATKHGLWKVGPAVNWASERGKIEQAPAEAFVRADGESEMSHVLRTTLRFK